MGNCCGLCKRQKPGLIPEGGIDAKRGCTDILFLILYIVFFVGWIVVAVVAFRNGNPVRLVKPSDYEGHTCGEDTSVKDLPNLFVPNLLNFRFGICVEECPALGKVQCKYDVSPQPTVNTSCLDSNFIRKIATSECHCVFYDTSPTLWRCLPIEIEDIANATTVNATATKQALKDLVSSLTVGQYLKQGWAEVYDARWAIFLSAFTALLVTLLWVFLIRFIVKPLVLTTVLLILILLVIAGVLCWRHANELRDAAPPGDAEQLKQADTYRGFAWFWFICAGIYLTLLTWLLSRIRIAIEIMKESSKALLSAKSMILVPPCSFVVLVAVGVWWLTVAAYIASIGKTIDLTFAQPEDGVHEHVEFAYKVFERDNATVAMQLYNLFGFFWTMNFVLALAYFCICSTVVCWYFSETTQSTEPKHTSSIEVLKSFKRGVRYHMGSLLFGSLLIAIIQMLRFLLEYFANKLDALKDNYAVAFVKCVAQCFLAYVERVINFINKNAYIVIAIRGKSFCSAAREALGLLIDNMLRVATTSFISSFVLFLCKVLITLTNLLIGNGLLASSIPTNEIKSGLFPSFVIGALSFVIATMFMNLYDDCIDTVLMCFFMDDDEDGRETYYMPEKLAKMVDKYTEIEDMRRQANAMMNVQPEDMDKKPKLEAKKSVFVRNAKDQCSPAPVDPVSNPLAPAPAW